MSQTENPIISIIVPVYNVEQYLHQCVDSILSQTFGEFELILIDDGSTDHSGTICDEYAVRDLRVKVLHQENQGPSAARNAGLDVMKGQYVAFIDSDDFVDKDYLRVLYTNAMKENADISICSRSLFSMEIRFSLKIQLEKIVYLIVEGKRAFYDIKGE